MPIIEFNPTSNNTTLNSLDVLKVSLNRTELLRSLDSISITWNPIETPSEFHSNEIRWSIDGINFSDWIPLAFPLTSLSNLLFSKQNYIWLEFRFIRTSTIPTIMELKNITINYTELILPKEQCPIPCPDPCFFPHEEIGQCSKLPNACSGIVVNCDNQLFKPTEYINSAACLYEQMTNAAASMFGWPVLYFKVDAEQKTKDIILHEYTLYNVVDYKYVNVVVPNNEFPSTELEYNAFDIDFSQDFEIQITRDHFHRAFGPNAKPEMKDYLYFPLMDRIWEVHSSYYARESTLQTPIFWKVKLFKWQDRVDVRRSGDVETIVDSLAVNFDEVFRQEEIEEFDRITHPIQYKTIGIANNDHIRSTINPDLLIMDVELMNYFTRVSKNCYDLSSIEPHNDLVLEYREMCNYSTNDNLSISFWWKSIKDNFLSTSNSFDTIINSLNGSNGIDLKVNYNINPLSGSINSFTLIVNSNTYLFDNLPILDFNVWYGFVINISNIHEQIDMRIWKILYNPNNPMVTSTHTTKLYMIYNKLHSYIPNTINSNLPFRLFSGTSYLTNIRLWKQPIPEESQSKILNQYIVKDSHNLRMADNAIKPLIASKKNSR